MKNHLASLLLVLLPSFLVAQERATGIALERFTVVALGWWLNQKCKFLAWEDVRAFGLDIAVVNTALATTINNPNLVLTIQASGKAASESDTYASCPTQAKEIVSYSASASNQWAKEVRKAVLDTASRLPGAPK